MLIIFLILIFTRPFISSRVFLNLNSLYSALFLLFLIAWFIYKGISIKKIQSLKYPLIFFSLALIISVIFSRDKLSSLKELYKYLSGLLLFLIAASLAYKDKIRLIHTIIFTGLIISLLAVYQYFFGFQRILSNYIVNVENINGQINQVKEQLKNLPQEELSYNLLIRDARINAELYRELKDKLKAAPISTGKTILDYLKNKRAFFPFITPNILAGYIAMIIPLALALTHKYKIWFIITLFLAFLLTKSLGALLSLSLVLVIYLYLQGKLEKRGIILLLGLSIIISLIFIQRLITPEYYQPISSVLRRLSYWKETLGTIRAFPLTGVGLGNFNLTHSRYTHNSYLQIWAEMGILGISSFLWLIFKYFQINFKKLKVSLNKNYFALGLLLANTAFLIHNFLDFSFFLPEVSLTWWLILGLLSSNTP